MIQALIIFSISYYTGPLIDSPASSFPGCIPLHIMVPGLLSNHMAEYFPPFYKLTPISISCCMHLYSQSPDAHIYARRNLSLSNSPCSFTTLLLWMPFPLSGMHFLSWQRASSYLQQCMSMFLQVEFTVLTFLTIEIFIHNSCRNNYALLQSFFC